MCENYPGSFGCICDEGYEGNGYSDTELSPAPMWVDSNMHVNCKDIDDCKSHPCLNGATCIDDHSIIDHFVCECPEGMPGSNAWAGDTCEIDVDECDLKLDDCDPSARAYCYNTDGSFMCQVRHRRNDG